jgi:hypothetical protein
VKVAHEYISRRLPAISIMSGISLMRNDTRKWRD